MAYNTDEGTSIADNYLDESFTSIGNSTRSLLSPILNEKLQIHSSSPEEEEPTEKAEGNEYSYDPEKSSNMVLTSISLQKKCAWSLLYRSHDATSTTSHGNVSFSSSCNSSLRSPKSEKEEQLSPWEDWLIKKTRLERKQNEKRKIEKWKEKRELKEKKKMEEEKRRKVEEKIEEWNAEKDEKEKEKKEKKKQEKEEKKLIEVKKQQQIEEKSAIEYKKWLKEKKEKELEVKKIKEIREMKKKEKEVEKRLKNEQAFKEWLKKSKTQPKQDCGSYGYTRGVLQSYCDWTSYPTPSYINPMPWIQYVSKKNKQSGQRNKVLQPVSPPLLFRDYEERRRKKNAV